MKIKFRSLLIVSGISILLLIGAVWFYIGSQSNPSLAHREDSTSATPAVRPGTSPSSSPAGVQPSRKEQENAMTKFLNTMNDSMKNAGIQETLAIVEQLKQAVASKDHGEIVRAFHEAIYGRAQKMSEALPAVRAYLTDADPFVRLTAARTLYTAGDRGGYETLHGMVAAEASIPDGKQDSRVEAARVLAKFREDRAANDIVVLYSKVKDGELLTSLATLGVRAPEAKQFPFVASDLAIAEYAMIGASDFLPKIAAMFQQTTDPDVKNAAAWAMARFGKEDYANYLAQMAQAAIEANPKFSEKHDNSTAALRYLGSLETPVANEVLERALVSNNPVAVQYAVVNLVFNRAEASDKAKQVVLRELRGDQKKLGIELMLNIASKLDDPEIRAAGEAFDQRSGNGSWKLYTTERKQWPIYNWIDDYVVVLKK